MDNDRLRRGKNTLHIEYDEATALLVGDALQTLGTEVLCSSENYPERRFKIISVLSKQQVLPDGWWANDRYLRH